MEFKDYYATLGLPRTATQDEIKRAYRKLARRFHPDVSKESNAESRFKEVAEAHEALINPERRAAYDDISQRHARGDAFEPPRAGTAASNSAGGAAPDPARVKRPMKLTSAPSSSRSSGAVRRTRGPLQVATGRDPAATITPK
jgi:DnaJ-class molecular chaperone